MGQALAGVGREMPWKPAGVMLSPARPLAKKRGQWGRAGRADSPSCPTLLLCPICECQEPAPLLPRAGNPPAGKEEGAAPAEVTTSGGMLEEGVSDKRGWPFICHQGVQTAAPSPGVILGLIFLFFLKVFKHKHAAVHCQLSTQVENPGRKRHLQAASTLSIRHPMKIFPSRVLFYHTCPMCGAMGGTGTPCLGGCGVLP